MRREFFSPSLLIIFSSCVIDCPTTTANSSLVNPQWSPSLPFQIPSNLQHESDGRPILTRVRDSIIQRLWGVPSENQPRGCTKPLSSPALSPPSTILARYGGDVVLRFRIQSVDEAKALAEAVDVLFLDVWEFTSEWVDIRLSKDIVGGCTP